MYPPDWLTQEEEALLSTIIETTIDFDIEQTHMREVVSEDE